MNQTSYRSAARQRERTAGKGEIGETLRVTSINMNVHQ